mmetsp:Transcript_68657/g.188327  ORF Transcript_68657/g.188327 Transcript_68657/m.188327 type:complete len:594 (-) Transcript_68657:601-2382(-)
MGWTGSTPMQLVLFVSAIISTVGGFAATVTPTPHGTSYRAPAHRFACSEGAGGFSGETESWDDEPVVIEVASAAAPPEMLPIIDTVAPTTSVLHLADDGLEPHEYKLPGRRWRLWLPRGSLVALPPTTAPPRPVGELVKVDVPPSVCAPVTPSAPTPSRLSLAAVGACRAASWVALRAQPGWRLMSVASAFGVGDPLAPRLRESSLLRCRLDQAFASARRVGTEAQRAKLIELMGCDSDGWSVEQTTALSRLWSAQLELVEARMERVEQHVALADDVARASLQCVELQRHRQAACGLLALRRRAARRARRRKADAAAAERDARRAAAKARTQLDRTEAKLLRLPAPPPRATATTTSTTTTTTTTSTTALTEVEEEPGAGDGGDGDGGASTDGVWALARVRDDAAPLEGGPALPPPSAAAAAGTEAAAVKAAMMEAAAGITAAPTMEVQLIARLAASEGSLEDALAAEGAVARDRELARRQMNDELPHWASSAALETSREWIDRLASLDQRAADATKGVERARLCLAHAHAALDAERDAAAAHARLAYERRGVRVADALWARAVRRAKRAWFVEADGKYALRMASRLLRRAFAD